MQISPLVSPNKCTLIPLQLDFWPISPFPPPWWSSSSHKHVAGLVQHSAKARSTELQKVVIQVNRCTSQGTWKVLQNVCWTELVSLHCEREVGVTLNWFYLFKHEVFMEWNSACISNFIWITLTYYIVITYGRLLGCLWGRPHTTLLILCVYVCWAYSIQ